MRKAVFLLGTPEWRAARKGQSLTDFVYDRLDRAASANDLDASIVFAVADSYLASKSKTDIGMERIRQERPRVLDQIAASGADLVICFGPVAAASLFDRGDLTENSLQRRKFNPLASPAIKPDIDPGDPGPDVYYTSSIEQIRMAPGMADWWDLDIAAACRGYGEPKAGPWELNPSAPLAEELLQCYLMGFDIETTGLDPWAPNAAIRMAQFSWRVGERMRTVVYDWDTVPTILLNALQSTEITKVGANIAFDVRWCRRFGVEVNNYVDLLQQEHVLYPGNPRLTLKDLAFKYKPEVANYNFQVERLAQEAGGDWAKIPAEAMYEYAAIDAQVSLAVAEAQYSMIASRQDSSKLLRDLYPLLTDMTIAGARVDMDVNQELDRLYSDKLAELKLQIAEVLGPINPDSPDQLARALKQAVPGIDLSQRRIKKALDDDRKIGGVGSSASYDAEDEDVSTDRQTLERESGKHPVIKLILEYRKHRVRRSTFVEGIREKHVVQHHGMHFIHPDFRSDVTETYRLSSRNPNGQNMPRNEKESLMSVKRQFVSRFPGGSIMEIDLSQIELRVAAWFTGDDRLRAALAGDVHREMAAAWMAKPVDQVSDFERQEHKPPNFAVVYGGGAKHISELLKISKQRAGTLIKQFYRHYTQLNAGISKVHAKVRIDLGVITPFGFRREFFPPDNWMSPDGFSVQRQAWNTIVQNTAACLMYCFMIRLHELLGQGAQVWRCMPIIQVHDSLVFDCPAEEVQELVRILQQAMAETSGVAARYGVQFDMPITGDIKVGDSWGTAEKLS